MAATRKISDALTPDHLGAFINRELSWLQFAARVLALAEDETVPLLERYPDPGAENDLPQNCLKLRKIGQ